MKGNTAHSPAAAWAANLERETYPLVLGDGLGVPGKVAVMANHSFRRIRTNDDGACGIHALFGTASHRGLHKADARFFLRQSLGNTAEDVRRNATNRRGGILCRLMNRLWYDVMKPQAQFDAHMRDALPHLLPEERRIWENVKQDRQLFHSCLAAVTEEHRKKTVFAQKRLAVVESFRALCREDLKEIFLAPLLSSMGLKESYFEEMEMEDVAGLPRGCMKIDVACVDCAQGARYRQSIVEYLGTQNFQELLYRVNDVVQHVGENDIERVADVFRFAEVVTDAQRYAEDAWQPVLEHAPFADFVDLVYPRYLDAMASDGYYLSDLELMLLCECARRNAVFVHRVQSADYFQRTVFKVQECVMPAGNAQEFIVVAIGVAHGATAVRGHFERLECVTRELPPPVDAGASSGKQASTGHKRGSPDAADGMDVDVKQNDEPIGQSRCLSDVAVNMDADEKQGGDGRSAMGVDAQQNSVQAAGERGSRARKSSGG